MNGQSYTSFSEASPTISFPGEIPHVQGGNATIIQLGASEIPGVDAGIYHLYSSEWSKDHNNLSIHETPNFNDVFRLQSVTLDLSTTSVSTDYTPLGVSPILLSYDQKLALMEANGFNNEDNIVVSGARMNLNVVDYDGMNTTGPLEISILDKGYDASIDQNLMNFCNWKFSDHRYYVRF